MYLQETDEQLGFRAELRAYFDRLMTPAIRAELREGESASRTRRQLFKQLGADGWLGVGWPVEYGGQGRSTADQFIFVDQARRADCPVPFVTLNTVGPTLIALGSDEHKSTYLPGILTGDIVFAIGYSEPSAGTDLASLTTRAERDGDEWVINGQKIWTSGAHEADYVWLACRTDPEAKKHRGISIIIVPTASRGFSCSPLHTVGGMQSNATFYDDVRVPETNLVGDLHGGWSLITSQLNHERVGMSAISVEAFELYDDVVVWARDPGPDGRRPIDVEWVRSDLARSRAKLAAMHLLNWNMVRAVEDGTLTGPQASGVKVYGTETAVDVVNLLLGVVGPAGAQREGSAAAVLTGRLERAGRAAQINTFGGGVNEIQRDMVAWMRLGLTRPGKR